MAAYASLTSLLLTLDNIRDHNLQVSLNPHKLESLRESLSFLQHYLQNCSLKTRSWTNREAMGDLEKKIRDVGFRAEDLVAAAMHQADIYTIPRLMFLIISGRPIFYLIGTFVILSILGITTAANCTIPSALLKSTGIIIFILPVTLLLVSLIGLLERYSIFPLFLRTLAVNLFVRNGTKDHWVLNDIFEEIERLADKAKAMIAGDATRAQLPLMNLPSARYCRVKDIGGDTVVGMDNDLSTIKEMLGYGSTTLQTVPIVGMGGIGKTTLAMLLYKDAYVRHQFDVCAWATVSQNYCFCGIVQDLLNSATLPAMQRETNNGELGDHLYRNLLGRRYLIVLDDVWDVEIWDNVRRFLPHDNNGSCVLLTTRNSDVAHYANSHGPNHQMRFLQENESQMLLHGQVFGEEDCSNELRVIRDEIAQSCKGLPLALVVIGGLLSKIDRTRDSWRSFADSLFLASNSEDDDECMDILALSYHHLPYHLRPCFLYMGMFPEDYVVPVVKLLQLWVAEGFLRPDTCTSPEELAEDCLQELLQRNLILVDSWSSRGRVKRCKIHDMIRKLCMREARKEKFLVFINRISDVSKTSIESYRRVSCPPNILKVHPSIMYGKRQNKSRAHSLVSIGKNFNPPGKNYFHYRPLKVLDLLDLHFPKFPWEVTKLICLRYLAMSFSGPFHPDVSRLQNLHIIIHRNMLSREIFSLPVEIWLIPNLRRACHTNSSVFSTERDHFSLFADTCGSDKLEFQH